MRLGDGGLTSARRSQRHGVDVGSVGEVVDGDPSLIDTLHAGGFLPVVASIAFDDDGAPLNVNADEAAAALARVVGARALLLLTDVPGVLDASGTLIPRLDAAAIDALIADGTVHSGMVPKLRGALEAAADAGCPACIAGWADTDALGQALLDGRLPGTVVVANDSTRLASSSTPTIEVTRDASADAIAPASASAPSAPSSSSTTGPRP